MKKIFICISLFLFVASFLNAQSGKYVTLIEKEKFSKAKKKLSKKYEKDSNNIEFNYAYTLLYNSKKYKAYNPYKSYKYILKTIQSFDELNNEEKEKYTKLEYTKEGLLIIKEECYNLAFNDCKDANTIDCFKNYISFFSDAPAWKKKHKKQFIKLLLLKQRKLTVLNHISIL